MELFFYACFERHMKRMPDGADELELLVDLVTRLSGEIDAALMWTLLDYLAAHGLQNEVQSFVDSLAQLVAARMTRLNREWQMIRKAYAAFLIDEMTLKWKLKWGPQRSEIYYQFVSQLAEEVTNQHPILIVLGGEMSGDMFGIGATMILKDESVVLIKKNTANQFDHADMIASFLETCVDDRKRVQVMTKAKVVWGAAVQDKNWGTLLAELRPKSAIDKALVPDSILMLPRLCEIMLKRKAVYWVCSLDTGTKYLKQRTLWEVTGPRARIRDRWEVGGNDFKSTAGELENWLDSKGFPIAAVRKAHVLGRSSRKRVLVLWSRFTGKKGEIHVEHDTSFKGTEDLARQALESKVCDFVIITGDKPVVHNQVKDQKARREKFDRICQQLNSEWQADVAFNLTAFWEDEKSKKWTLGSRTGQFRLYEYLHRTCDVRHIGMRSGNLEALAMLGYWVRYLEETQSWGGERMEQWHGRALGYERILISTPPTRTGKYIIARVPKGTVHGTPKDITWLLARNNKNYSKSAWWPDVKPQEIDSGGKIVRKKQGEKKVEEEQVEVPPFPRGFAKIDLEKIIKALRGPNFRLLLETWLP